jgi:alpha-galactosidase
MTTGQADRLTENQGEQVFLTYRFMLNSEAVCRYLKLGGIHPHTLESLKKLTELYEEEELGKPKKTNEWRAKLPQTENMSK